MNRIAFTLIAILGLFNLTTAQEGDALFHIDGQPVSVDEFEYIYNKNNFNNKADYSESSIREYLDLYINFRLKVKEAESLGLDKDPKLQSELKVYQEQLYNSFYDREKLSILVDEAIERSKSDVSIAHIYISSRATDPDSAKAAAMAKINEAYEALESGKSYDQIAAEYSEDKYTKQNGGLLGYYTALQIAFYPLESAAYQTPEGSYSKPIQTNLGYHIVKVQDKREARGQVKVALIKLNKKKDETANEEVRTKIYSIYEQLNSGTEFADVALAKSEDPVTRGNGGEMEWFGIAEFDPIFEDAAFNLNEIGEISEPFETMKAWYILKLSGKKPTSELENERDIIVKKVKQSDRYAIMRKEHINKILDQYGFAVKQPAFDDLKSYAVAKLNASQFNFDDLPDSTVIANITGINYSNVDFIKFIGKNNFKYRRMTGDQKFNVLFEDFKEENTISFHVLEYGKENPEYGSLLNEYRDGILLFDLMESKVWSKAVQDTAGLRQYYEANKENYVLPEQAVVRVFEVNDSKSAELLVKALESDPELTDMEWLSKLSKKDINTAYNDLKISRTDELSGKISWGTGINIVSGEDGISVMQVTEIIPQKLRAFEDSKGFVVAGFQEYLEEQWIANLRTKYEVVIDEKILKGLIK